MTKNEKFMDKFRTGVQNCKKQINEKLDNPKFTIPFTIIWVLSSLILAFGFLIMEMVFDWNGVFVWIALFLLWLGNVLSAYFTYRQRIGNAFEKFFDKLHLMLVSMMAFGSFLLIFLSNEGRIVVYIFWFVIILLIMWMFRQRYNLVEDSVKYSVYSDIIEKIMERTAKEANTKKPVQKEKKPVKKKK